MLHDALQRYLASVETAIKSLRDVYIEDYEEEILTLDRVDLRIRIRFLSGELLEVNEAVIYADNNVVHLNYRYHFQDEKNRLIFRYDNSPHHPEAPSFPHHKHTRDEVVSTEKPTIQQALQEASGLITD